MAKRYGSFLGGECMCSKVVLKLIVVMVMQFYDTLKAAELCTLNESYGM